MTQYYDEAKKAADAIAEKYRLTKTQKEKDLLFPELIEAQTVLTKATEMVRLGVSDVALTGLAGLIPKPEPPKPAKKALPKK